MSKLTALFGYALAALALPIVLATFIGQAFWMKTLVDVTGWTVSPWYTGDAVIRTVEHADYETRIHQPVFQALIGERPEGFVQVDWAPPTRVPTHLSEAIDYNGDGQPDFKVDLDTMNNQATITPLTPAVIGLRGTYRLKEAWAVRVDLKNGR